MKAVVLAAGEGRRLWPLTENRPKPMLPVANRPLLEHVVDALVDAGVDEIVLVVGYKRERIQNHFVDHDWDVDLTYVVQDKQLGTGHALLQAEPLIGGEFIAINGDRIVESSLISRVWEEHQKTQEPVMAVANSETPSRYGVVDVEDGVITGIRERPPQELVTSSLINAGVYALDPSIFSVIRETESRGEQRLTDALMNMDLPVRPVQFSGLWLDVSFPWDLIAINGSVLEYTGAEHDSSVVIDGSAVVSETTSFGAHSVVQANATVLRGTTLGENVSVGPNVVLENSVVLSDVTIKSSATVKDCIIGANTEIGPGTVIEGGSAAVALDDAVYRDVKFGGLIGDNTTLGGNTTLRPGTILGNHVTLESGATADGHVDSNTTIK